MHPNYFASVIKRSLKGSTRLPVPYLCHGTRTVRHLTARAPVLTGNNIKDMEITGKVIKLVWADGRISSFHHIWLRDHCNCPKCLHPKSRQRMLDTFSIPLDIAPKAVELNNKHGGQPTLHIQWDDSNCESSQFELSWLRQHCYSTQERNQRSAEAEKAIKLWDAEIKDSEFFPEVEYDDFMASTEGMMRGLTMFRHFGLFFVKNTPPTVQDTEAFAEKIAFVKKTLYGLMWSTSADTPEEDFSDTAYTNLELRAHTDCTYLRDPVGVQIFNCVQQGRNGGASRFVDGFNVIARLRRENPSAFQFFNSQRLPQHTYDDGYILSTCEPTIVVDDGGNPVQFRYNNYDRAPLKDLSFEQVEEFYKHHKILESIVRDPKMELAVTLSPGHMAVVDNQRVMHGRHSFAGKRRLIGCYLGRDEVDSKLRELGLL